MATPRKLVQGILDGNAHRLAFRIAQSLERTLVARAVELAARDGKCSGEVLVTSEHIRQGLGGDLINEACAKIGVFVNGSRETEGCRSPARA
jgi:hypothetical protein